MRWLLLVAALLIGCASARPARTIEWEQGSDLQVRINSIRNVSPVPGYQYTVVKATYANTSDHSVWIWSQGVSPFYEIEIRKLRVSSWKGYQRSRCVPPKEVEIRPGESFHFAIWLPDVLRGQQLRIWIGYREQPRGDRVLHAVSPPRVIPAGL